MRSSVILTVSSIAWTLSVAYALLAFYRKITRIRFFLGNDLFSPSRIPWFTEEDTSDAEWAAFRMLLKSLIPAILLQIVLVHLIPKRFGQQGRILISTVFLLFTFGLRCTLFIFAIFLTTFCLRVFKLNRIIYAVNLLIVFFGVYKSELLQKALGSPLKDENSLLLFDVSIAWAAIRAISFGVMAKSEDSPVTMCCYYLYLPCLILGPVTNFTSFANQFKFAQLPPKIESLKRTLKSTVRMLIWLAIMELMNHTMFTMASRFDYHMIRNKLLPVEYLGFSAVLMAHFYVKYLIIYGLAEEAALAEGIWLPERPRCTLRLTSGVEVWRTFDRGLYLWFLELIYVSLGGNSIASMLCFAFVCFWHACFTHVQIWCGLNFLLVAIEKQVSKLPGLPRVFLQCFLHWLAVGSNMYYLGGSDVGYDFFIKLLVPKTFCLAFIVSLFGCVVGRQFQQKDKLLYKTNAQRFNINKAR